MFVENTHLISQSNKSAERAQTQAFYSLWRQSVSYFQSLQLCEQTIPQLGINKSGNRSAEPAHWYMNDLQL